MSRYQSSFTRGIIVKQHAEIFRYRQVVQMVCYVTSYLYSYSHEQKHVKYCHTGRAKDEDGPSSHVSKDCH